MIEVFVDGASRGQGKRSMGDASCAVVIFDRKKPVAHYARGLGKRTNNEAEYEALITALLMCTMSNYADPIIYSDSAVVVNQVSGKWSCKNEKLVPLWMSVKEIQEEYRFRLYQVDRTRVALADSLANKFLDNLEELRLSRNEQPISIGK
jgi:ribonuclease HI